jgi:uncharacterized protein (DUF362 family)
MTARDWSRRDWMRGLGVAGLGVAAAWACSWWGDSRKPVFIGRATGYDGDLEGLLSQGLLAVGLRKKDVQGMRVLLKPNLVEPNRDRPEVNTHPAVVAAAVAAFRSWGAHEVRVGEGAGHRRDALYVLEESGLADVIVQEKVPFRDLNTGRWREVPNRWGLSRLPRLAVAEEVLAADLVVSMAKMKTHHWAGVTLSMKNLFGTLPSAVYGYPKNVLHWHGIEACILDACATVRPQIAIVDGIVAMEGDGPIMGDPTKVGALVVGRNLVAVDATCARIMDIDPRRVPYLAAAGPLGPLAERDIAQRGEAITAVRHRFRLIPEIPIHHALRS